MSFAYHDRLAKGHAFETEVLMRLIERGVDAFPWGQGLLSTGARDSLKTTSSPVRWFPDILVVKDKTVLHLDPKDTQRDTPNYAAEVSSVDAHQRWSRATGETVLFVWPDWKVTPAHLIDIQRCRRMPGVNFGRTDYYLIPKSESSWHFEFDAIFPEEP